MGIHYITGNAPHRAIRRNMSNGPGIAVICLLPFPHLLCKKQDHLIRLIVPDNMKARPIVALPDGISIPYRRKSTFFISSFSFSKDNYVLDMLVTYPP